MSKEKKSTNVQIYKRLLGYAMNYKKRLFLGIACGMVAGGSIFGVLAQAEKLLSSFGKNKAPDEVIVEVQRGDKIEKLKVEHVTREVDGNNIPSDFVAGDDVLKVTPVFVPIGSDQIPPWAKEFLENTVGVELYNKRGQPTGIIVVLAAIGFVILMLLKTVATYFNRFFMRWVGLRVVTDLRNILYAKLMNQSMEFHGRESIGDMMSRCSNDINRVQTAVSNNVSILTRAPVEIIAVVSYVAYFAYINKLYDFLVVLFIGMPLSILPVILLGKKVKKYATKTLKKISDVMDQLQETLSCMRVVKAYNMEESENAKFSNTSDNYFRIVMRAMKYELLMAPLMEFVAILALCAFMLYSFGKVDFKDILVLGIATNFAYRPLKELAKLNANIQKSLAAAERIFGYLDMNYEIPQSPNAVAKEKFEESISFENVSFSYGEVKNLDNISLNIKKGDFVAFVGEAGSGKSTLVNMVARFYDIQSGSIKIDGVDVRDISKDSIHDLIGYVDQRTILFNSTVRKNIGYGSAGVSEEEIIKAAERADVMSFISEKDEGLEFEVGAKGVKLSGGQCQRVAIARAMLKNPPIMILDEATSALDNVTEQIVQKAINELMGDRTVLAIAHRLSTVKDADCIYVLDKGKVIESGTHNELLANDGQYAKMWNIQFKEVV
ncbi:MAG: ABC transporter ATP-binding protein/permease [Lentisphaerales bacterium]|nr:ABC transporter ATP-binding protein/permease [Lentisphaerales bacterium]